MDAIVLPMTTRCESHLPLFPGLEEVLASSGNPTLATVMYLSNLCPFCSIPWQTLARFLVWSKPMQSYSKVSSLNLSMSKPRMLARCSGVELLSPFL